MKLVPTKADNIDSLAADEFNPNQDELENSVETTGQIANEFNPFQVPEAMARYAATGGVFYQDSGTANTYVLSALANFITPTVYLDGMAAIFKTVNLSTGPSTINISGIGVKDLTLPNGTAITNEIVPDEYHTVRFNEDDDRVELESVSGGAAGQAGLVVQIQHLEDGEVATGTNILPFDDTIPINTDGDLVMQLSITPQDALNILFIEVLVHLDHSASDQGLAAALFRGNDLDAVAVGLVESPNVSFKPLQVTLRHRMVAGGTSAFQIKVRAGAGGAGTTTFNGKNGARRYGGVLASSITIWEVKP